ncbi:MAG: hypothetical protein PF961_13035 [Planctomycetota bacterium]|jgi:hypothetical protein|nr:hypothetical protein [Planctomycetota bacterium]
MRRSLALLLLLCGLASAHDIGLHAARLSELDANRYQLEIDASRDALRSLSETILPDRCTMVSSEDSGTGALWQRRITFTSAERALGPDDAILLRWDRPGLALSTQWRNQPSRRLPVLGDGSLIVIHLDQFLRASTAEPAKPGLLRSLPILCLHLLLAIACMLAAPHRAWLLLGLWSGGHALGLIALDLGLPGPDPRLLPLSLGVTTILLIRAQLRGHSQLSGLCLLSGILVASHDAAALSATATPQHDYLLMIVAVAAFHAAGALLGMLLGGASAPSAGRIRRIRISSWLVAGLLVAPLLLALQPRPSPPEQPDEARLSAPLSSLPAVPQATSTAPIQAFVTIETAAIRSEVLIDLAQAPPALLGLANQDTLPAAQHDAILAHLRRTVATASELALDSTPVAPDQVEAQFVEIDSFGVRIDNQPRERERSTSMVGVTLNYPLASAQSLSYALDLGQPIPGRITDGERSQGGELNKGTALTWRIMPPPQLAAPPLAQKPRAPLLGLALLGLALLSTVFIRGHKRRSIALVLLIAAIPSYALLRTPLPHSMARSHLAANEAPAVFESLLINIHHALEAASESASYDRLAQSVTDPALTTIYLEQRRQLALEQLGGARARIDAVTLDRVAAVPSATSDLAFTVDWTLSGSVSHFGHSHYRRNRNQARIHLRAVDGYWRISEFDVLDTERER